MMPVPAMLAIAKPLVDIALNVAEHVDKKKKQEKGDSADVK
ncbi:hypothetical protein [Rugamonas rubra]|uniref:Uncharacterized protein n=1 Tax=Rugamonas rubra TaxID=758825 RepID=A0A1I4M4D0_9BURK|nr:hypothetical protein [Rugamonas rubra]SFL98081.1 hypothetical protein SAMN02982985_02235 [Rugamonas rubra]